MSKPNFIKIFGVFLLILSASGFIYAQDQKRQNQKVRSVTIPVSISSKQEIREKQAQEFLETGDIIVKEDGEDQIILSIRSVSNTPLSLAVLIQDDLDSNVNLQLKDLANFIRNLPNGSRVLVGYLRGGTLQVRQKFTDDLEKAANSLRIVIGNTSSANSPYTAVEEALERFDALPLGRRAILLVSDGLDASRGFINSSPTQSLDLDRAILKAQRKSVAVYSFYNAGSLTRNAGSSLVLNAQSSLQRLADETGGRAFFQGTISPISFEPFFRDLTLALNRQFALTYLSTHMKKGYHKVQVTSTNPEVKIEHPKGYYYR